MQASGNPTAISFLQFSGGVIEIYVLSSTSGRPTVSVIGKFSNTFLFEDEVSLYASRNRSLFFDGEGCFTYRINERSPNDKAIASIELLGANIFVIDWIPLCMSLGDHFPLTRRVICADSGRVPLSKQLFHSEWLCT